MSSFKLYLLGAPQLELNGEAVSVDTRKAIALLAYLVMTSAGGGAQSHTRDALAALLWPELDQSRSRAALRRTLSPLRRALEKRVLDVTRDTVGIRSDAALWVDAVEFRRLLARAGAHHHDEGLCPVCRDLLEQAVALYHDDFMAGFNLRDAPDFDEWHYFESEQLRRALAGALERLTHSYALAGDFDRALAFARRHLALDPLAEQAHRNLMQLFAWSGQRNMAVRQYRECVRILEQELGVPPLGETTALYELILSDELQPLSPPPPHPLTPSIVHPLAPSPATLPLVGRGAELARMQAAYDAARRKGHFLAVEGEAGVGKTRLAEEFVGQAPGRTIRARCYEGETNLTYSPFIEALRRALEQAPQGWQARVPAHWLAEAARLLPELSPDAAPPQPLAGPGAQSRFFEAICRVLLALAADHIPQNGAPGDETPPGILFFDDLHWADDTSLDLLAYLVKRLWSHPLLVLVTWRSEALPPGHRLHSLVAGAQRGNDGTHITLDRLTMQEVQELLEFARPAGQALPPGWSRRLYRETEGLPFFVVEYLKTALDNSAEPDGGAGWAMPAGVRGLLQSRLEGVDEIGWQLLNTAAVIGRSFDFDTCRLASGRSEEEAVAALDNLLARGLIEEVRSSTGAAPAPLYDFSHNQMRALVYRETSLVRRRLLHRRVAEALIQHGYDEGQTAQIAHHYRLAGRDAQAAGFFVRAAEHARALYANAAALAHLRTALALGHPDVAGLHEAIGDLQTLLGEYGGALSSYEVAIARAPVQNQAALEHKLGNVYDRRGEWQRAESHFEAALAAVDGARQTDAAGSGAEADGSGLRARIYADWSLTAHHQGAGERALMLAQEARMLVQEAQDRPALAQVHNILGILARHQGDLDEARRSLQRSLDLATAAGLLPARIAALNNLALVQGEARQEEQALQTLEEALRLCQELGDRHREAALQNNLADLHHAAGRSEEAISHLKRAAAIFTEIGGDIHEWQPEIWKLTEW